jgi:glycoside/pentoside/hexuronide:cation symporter, GPH family
VSTAPAGQVPKSTKFFHGFGSIAYGIKENGFSTFLLLFYNQVVGMDARLVGAALAIAMVVDAFADPIIGHMSDRTYTRWGRRLPWLYLAAVPLGASWMLLWQPPGFGGWQAFLYLVVTAIFVRTLVSACEVPSVAILPELTQDYDERTKLMRLRYLFAWAGGLLMLFLAYGVFLVSKEEGQVGQLMAEGYWLYGLTGAILMTATVLISAVGQHKRLAFLPAQRPERTTAGEAVREIWASVSHPAYLVLISTIAFAAVSTQVTYVLSNYLYIFVWRFPQGWFQAYPWLLFGSVIVAFFLVAHFNKNHGKRETAFGGIFVNAGFWLMPFLLFLAGFWPAVGTNLSTGMVFAFFFVANCAGVVVQISIASMIADVVEASEEQTGRRSEGLLYAGNLFVQKCATGAGILISGLIISWAGLPEKADPATVAAPVIDSLVIGYISVVVLLGLGVIWRIRKFPISRSDHEERVAKLAAANPQPAE